jgi:hypothetical protein
LRAVLDVSIPVADSVRWMNQRFNFLSADLEIVEKLDVLRTWKVHSETKRARLPFN